MNCKQWILRLILAIVCLIVGSAVYMSLLRWRGSFHWDEAAHALKGLLIAHDIQQGDWVSFLYDTYRQVLWPPLHSWFAALAFLIAGPGTVVAGGVSLVAFIASAPAIYAAGGRMQEQHCNRAGLFAALLWLTSPALVPFSVQSMLEIPGLFALIVTILVYFWLLQSQATPRRYAWLGLSVAFTYFVRTHYGVLIFLAILANMLIEARFHPGRLFDRRFLYLVLPLLLIFGFWFAYPPKFTATLGWLINYPAGVDDPFGAEGWLFYPLGWFRIAGGPALGMIYFAVVVIAFKWRNNPTVRLLLVVIVGQILIGEFHHNKQDRYIFPVLPALFLLTGFVLDQAWRLSSQRQATFRYWAPRGLTVVLLLFSAIQFVDALRPPVGAPTGAPIGAPAELAAGQMVKHLAQEIRNNGATLIIGSMDLDAPSPPLLDWQLIVEEKLMAAPQAGSALQIDEERAIIALLDRQNLPGALVNLVRPTLQRSEQIGVTRSIYAGLPLRASYSQSQEQFCAFLERSLTDYPFDSVIVVTSLSANARYPLDFFAPCLEEANVTAASSAEFPDDSVRVDLFRVEQ